MVVINASTGIDKVQDGSIQPEDLAQKMTLMTAQTATGTAIDFTGIPSWAKRITVMFNGVSTSSTSALQIQLGTSSGVETTGYVGCGTNLNSSTTASSSYVSGFRLGVSITAAYFYSGFITINSFGNNIYTANGVIGDNSDLAKATAGGKTLSGTLDRIRITTVNGTDTFDAGTINIMYEG